MKKRHCGFDNFRGFLILCVIAGHMLELISGNGVAAVRDVLYYGIYSFHIPALIFLSGCFGKFSWRRMGEFAAIYLVFQTVYLLFCMIFLKSSFPFQYHTPYWLLWYLVSLLTYQLLIPLLDRVPQKFAAWVIAGSVLIALLVGYADFVGYPFSLSRTLVFLPFFVLGYYAGRHRNKLLSLFRKEEGCWKWYLAGAAVMTVLLYVAGISGKMLYGSYSYALGYGPVTRVLIMATATLWIMALLELFLTKWNRPVLFLTSVGRNSLPAYLLHGFAVRLMGKYNWDCNSILIVMAATVVLAVLLGNPWVSKIFTGFKKPQKSPGKSRESVL